MRPSCKFRKENVHLVAFDGAIFGRVWWRYIWCTCATCKGQAPHAHHPLCTPAPPFWQLSTWMGYPHSLLAWKHVPQLVWACLRTCLCASTAAPARESMWKYYGCVHVSSCADLPVKLVCCVCYRVPMISEAKDCPVRERKESCTSEVAPLMMPCPSCTLLLQALLAPIPWPWAPATVSGQGFVRCLSSLFTTAVDMIKLWHMSISEPWGNRLARRNFFLPYSDIVLIWFIVSIQANPSLEGSLELNQQVIILACYILKNVAPYADPNRLDLTWCDCRARIRHLQSKPGVDRETVKKWEQAIVDILLVSWVSFQT